MTGDMVSEVRQLKMDGEGMAILGSGSIVAQLAPERLIDEYQVVVNPVVLGNGRTMFDGITEKLNLKLTRTRAFGNGKGFPVLRACALKTGLRQGALPGFEKVFAMKSDCAGIDNLRARF